MSSRRIVWSVTLASLLSAVVLLTTSRPTSFAKAPDPASASEAPDPEPAPTVSGTQRMVSRLETLAQEIDPGNNPYLSAHRIEILKIGIAETKDPRMVAKLQVVLARELLNNGDVDEAISVIVGLGPLVRTGSPDWARLKMLEAVAHLRRAERENCQMHHNPDSCLFPIRTAGVHGKRAGAEGAVRILTELLEALPDDRQARWLLNVAVMTLGEYPDGVPERWRLGPELFESEHDVGRFPDVATRLNVDVDDLCGGAILEDFDGDRDLDLIASAWGTASQLRYFRNDDGRGFTEQTEAAGLVGLVGGLNVNQADYDNDGDADVLVLRGAWLMGEGRHPNSLLRNDGGGRFTDVTEEAGLLSFHPTQTAAWLDYDGDGRLDLFVGNESTRSDPHPCELFRNNGDGTFTEVAAAVGVAHTAYVKGVAAGDYDNDGRPDLYLSVLGGPNVLYRNDGPGTGTDWSFTDVAEEAGVTEPRRSFPTWFFDYDNDGWLDLFVSAYAFRDIGDFTAEALGGQPRAASLPRLYRNRGDGTFENVTRQANLDRILLTMGAGFGDLDNDGWLDFYAGTGDPDFATLVPNKMFRNAGGRFFQDVTTSGGFGHLQKGHGVSFADFDEDGDQDVYAVMGGAFVDDHFRNALFENPGHGNRFVKLVLEGTGANRAGVGARVRVTVRSATGTRTIHRVVGSGSSFGANPLRLEVGLGQAQSLDRVEIDWPGSGTRQVVEGLELDRAYRIREGGKNTVERR